MRAIVAIAAVAVLSGCATPHSATPIAPQASVEGLTPVAESLRARSDGWERDMLFDVNNSEVDVTQARFAVTGCDVGQGFVAAVEIDGDSVDRMDPVEWIVGGPLIASRIAEIVCGEAAKVR
jgi:hypothetical protein